MTKRVEIPPMPPIVIDTREQLPWSFEDLPTVREKLDAGDYSVRGARGSRCDRAQGVHRSASAPSPSSASRFERKLERPGQLRARRDHRRGRPRAHRRMAVSELGQSLRARRVLRVVLGALRRRHHLRRLAPQRGDPRRPDAREGGETPARRGRGQRVTTNVVDLDRARRGFASRRSSPSARRTAECSDLANAERLIALHGGDLRHVAELGGWFGFDGRRWQRDGAFAERCAKDIARRLVSASTDALELAAQQQNAKGIVDARALLQLGAPFAGCALPRRRPRGRTERIGHRDQARRPRRRSHALQLQERHDRSAHRRAPRAPPRGPAYEARSGRLRRRSDLRGLGSLPR